MNRSPSHSSLVQSLEQRTMGVRVLPWRGVDLVVEGDVEDAHGRESMCLPVANRGSYSWKNRSRRRLLLLRRRSPVLNAPNPFGNLSHKGIPLPGGVTGYRRVTPLVDMHNMNGLSAMTKQGSPVELVQRAKESYGPPRKCRRRTSRLTSPSVSRPPLVLRPRDLEATLERQRVHV